jgi:hypothetical protein
MLIQERNSCTELECVPVGYLLPVVHLLETTSMRLSCENPRSQQCDLLCLPTRSPSVSQTKIFSAAALQVTRPTLEEGRFFHAGVRHGANREVQMEKMARRQKCLNHNTHFQIYDLSSNCFSTTSRYSPIESHTELPTDKTPRGKF